MADAIDYVNHGPPTFFRAGSLDDWPIPVMIHEMPFRPGFRHFAYRPQVDITAYELACALPWALGRSMSLLQWHSLGAIQRHFDLIEALPEGGGHVETSV